MSEKYYVAGFFDRNYRGVDDNLMTDSYDDAIDFAWKLVNNGDYIQLKNNDTGEEYRFEPDEVLDGMDYEFGNLEDIFHSVFIDEEPLEEASYGGAFDIEDNQFFTRDDLNELIDVINEKCPEGLQATEAYMGNDGKTLEVVFDWSEYGQDSVYKKIDMRAIRKPSDLFRYADELIEMGKDKLGYIDDGWDDWEVDSSRDDWDSDEDYFSLGESIETPYGPYWYYTKHGVGPGSVPRDITILKYAYDEENDPWGTYFLSDKLILTDDLRRYDLKEKFPPKGAVDGKGNLINQKDWGFNESLTESAHYEIELDSDDEEIERDYDTFFTDEDSARDAFKELKDDERIKGAKIVRTREDHGHILD